MPYMAISYSSIQKMILYITQTQKLMKIILKILSKVILVIIITALIQTAFSLQSESFKYPDQMGNEYGIPIIFSIIIILMAGTLTYYLFSKIIKTTKNRLVISTIIVAITIIFYFVEFKKLNSLKENGNNIAFVQDRAETDYIYDEKLMSFKSPYKLQEENSLENNTIIKAFGNKDLSIIYIEMDGETMKVDDSGNKEEMKSKFDDLSLPKLFFADAFKQRGIEINPDDIDINHAAENRDLLAINLDDGSTSFMFLVKKGYFFSMLQIIHNKNASAQQAGERVLSSVKYK